MLCIIRTTTLRTLRADIAEADDAANAYSAEAEKWHKHYTDEVQRADEAEQTAQHTAELRGEDRDHYAERIDLYEKRIDRLRHALATARAGDEATAAVLAEMREDLDQIRTDAADPETGASFRAALAYSTLRRMYDQHRAAGLDLGRPWDLLAAVLGFDEPRELEAADADSGGSEAGA